MGNVFNYNGSTAITSPTLGNILALDTIRVVMKNVTWTDGEGTLFSQAGDTGTERELSVFAAGNVFNIFAGGDANSQGADSFTTIFGDGGIQDATVDFTLNLNNGDCIITVDGSEVFNTSLSVGNDRVSGCLFRLGGRADSDSSDDTGSEWFLSSGMKCGDTDVYEDGVITRTYRKDTLTGSDWPETTSGQDGTVFGTASWSEPATVTPPTNETLTIAKDGPYQGYPYNKDGSAVNCQVPFDISASDDVEVSINGGSFTTVISNAPSGANTHTLNLTAGVYDVTYRLASDTGATDSHTLVVGYGLGVGGHSNISGRGDNNQVVVPSSSGVTAYVFKNNDQWAVLTDPSDSDSGQVDSITADSQAGGSILPHIANIWLEQNPDIPIFFNVNAKGGSQLIYWMKGSSERESGLNRYDSLTRRVNKAGGINDMLFFIGGNDTLDNRATYTQEKTNLIQFAADIKADFGADTLLIPLPDYSDKVNRPIGDVVYGQDAIRMAIQDAALESPNIYVTESIYAVGVGSDGVHSTSDQQLTDAGRITGRSLWNLDTQCAVSIPGLDSSDGVFTVVGTSNSVEVLNERMFLTSGVGGTPAFNLAVNDPIELVLDNGTDTYTVQGFVGGTLTEQPVVVPNQPPTANAGPDQSVAAGALVQVSASGSTDGDGTIVGYKWRETTSSGITLSSTDAENISFTSPVSDTAQTVTLELIVTNDDGVDSAPVYVNFNVAAEVDTTPPVIILQGGNIALQVGETFVEPGYQAFDNKGVDITSQVTVTGSTSTAFPRVGTLEYNVVADGIAAETQTRIFTITAESELLEAVAKQKFLRDNTVISAFTGRSNIEELKFQLASTNTKIALDNQGYYDFDENETQKVIVVTDDGEISSDNGDVEWKGSSLFVRFGAFSSRKSQLSARVVVFLAGDERGVVIAGPGLNANLIVKFN